MIAITCTDYDRVFGHYGLRFEHDDPKLRTERVIAAMLEMDPDDVQSGLSVLEREGKVVCRWIDGKESWFARTKRGL